MSIGTFIASAAGWDERRRAPLKRLQAALPNAITITSEVKEHSSVWALRMYRRALASPHLHFEFLNDDVIPCPSHDAILERIVAAVPDQVMSFATICPEVEGHRGMWLRSYLLSGPAYLYPRADLESLVEFYEKLPAALRDKMNEDEVASHHAWSRQRPIWQTAFALVKHDVSIPSTLGYDHHKGRVSTAPLADERTLEYSWIVDHDPPHVPHPWLPEGRMRMVARAASNGEDPNTCSYCAVQEGMFTSGATGAKICPECIKNITNHIFSNMRPG